MTYICIQSPSHKKMGSQAKEGSLDNYTATDAELNERENIL